MFLASSTRHFVTFVIFLFHRGNFEKWGAHALRFLVLLFFGVNATIVSDSVCSAGSKHAPSDSCDWSETSSWREFV